MKQSNIESITEKALPLLGEGSSPQDVKKDWITNFFDKSRIISDLEMQALWSKVLAGEANDPDTFSRRTVNLLADLDKTDAELFVSLCSFSWMFDNVVPIVFDINDEIYNRSNIGFGLLSHLETLGLIRFDNMVGFVKTKLPKRFVASYHGRPLQVTLPNEFDNDLSIGKVILPQAGGELARICGAAATVGFFEYVCEKVGSTGSWDVEQADEITVLAPNGVGGPGLCLIFLTLPGKRGAQSFAFFEGREAHNVPGAFAPVGEPGDRSPIYRGGRATVVPMSMSPSVTACPIGSPVFALSNPASAGSTLGSKFPHSADDHRRPSWKSITIPASATSLPSRLRCPSIWVMRRASA